MDERRKIDNALNALRRATVASVHDSGLYNVLHVAEENLRAELNPLYEERGWGPVV